MISLDDRGNVWSSRHAKVQSDRMSCQRLLLEMTVVGERHPATIRQARRRHG